MLGDVCTIVMGQAPDGSTYNELAEGLPLVAGAGDLGAVSPIAKKYTSAPGKISSIGDIILCIRATIGDTNWSDQQYCLGRGVAGLRAKPDVLDQRFLWHFIGACRSDLEARGSGSTFKQVARADIADWAIPTPPLAEQQRIATILDKADSLRRKRQEAIRLADEFLRAVFIDMFGRKPKTKVLTDYCEFLAGFAFKSEQYVPPSEGVRLLRGINVGIGRFEWSDTAGYKADAVKGLDRYQLEAGDVVIAMDRPWISSGLKCAVVDQSVAGNFLVQRVARLRPKQSSSEMFIFNCLQGTDFKSHCRITETTIPHISPKDFATYPVPNVAVEDLSAFASVADRVRSMSLRTLAADGLVDQLQASLQHELLGRG
jgi:type I restriction enzyme S subunit